MVVFKKVFLVVALILGVYSVQAQTLDRILKNGVLRVGMSGDQPPFSMMSNGDSLMGYEVDVANLLASSMKVKLEIVQLPFAELLPALDAGKVDAVMSGMTITPQRNLKYAFMGPYMLSGKTILTKSATLAKAQQTEELDLKNAKLVVLKGSTSEEFANELLSEAQIIPAATYQEAVDMIVQDKADAMIADYEVCALSVLRYPSSSLVMSDRPLTLEPIGMALNADDHHFMNFLENYFAALQLAGVLDDLQLYWFSSGAWLIDMK